MAQILSIVSPIYQIVAKKSQEAKNDTAKLKKVQDQASSSIEVKKSLINLVMKSRIGDHVCHSGDSTCACHAPPQPYWRCWSCRVSRPAYLSSSEHAWLPKSQRFCGTGSTYHQKRLQSKVDSQFSFDEVAEHHKKKVNFSPGQPAPCWSPWYSHAKKSATGTTSRTWVRTSCSPTSPPSWITWQEA